MVKLSKRDTERVINHLRKAYGIIANYDAMYEGYEMTYADGFSQDDFTKWLSLIEHTMVNTYQFY